MARLALWTFNEAPGSGTAADSETGDGLAQDGIYQSGATTDGAGSGVFDGIDDYVEIPHDPGFDLDTGSIVITFTQDTVSSGSDTSGSSSTQTLFSRDSQGYDGGGHLSISVKSDGSLSVRHQDTNSTTYYSGGAVTPGQPTTLVYSWSPSGSQLSVDGVVVDSGTKPHTMAGNSEPITIGASQARSGNNEANNLASFFDGTIDAVALYDDVVAPTAMPCFTQGTLIRTPAGAVPVESLCAGQLVCTLHHGPQPILWIGTRRFDLARMPGENVKLRPVRITAGALGRNLPARDLLVSRQHRMAVSSRIAARMLGSGDALVAAIKLTTLPGVFVDESVTSVTYLHILFDRHEVIFAEGAPTESLYACPEAMKALSPAARQEILTLFPELDPETRAPAPALPIPTLAVQRQLVARHAKTNKPLLDACTGTEVFL